ncbi:transporter substrate-binding domain-containing protein [Agrobacterium rhizogenes]|uniref:transporter substrate-binding domain-containing protein n=1 Tax=Rhizobium rhizogenes TaxID=359 RepID=UPI0015728860|nr:transporter substrate-binding domain-containing protein [Rhizobium rhizogenes]NTG48232.1 transporter substrate-binding domain-containing protein [Rhizobium rhizogenes]
MNSLKTACMLVGAACLALTAVAADAHSLDEILSAKKIVVGINPNLPPLGRFNDKNEIEGFDVDVAKKLGEMLGVEVSLVQVSSADRVPFLATGKADIVLGALTRTADRAKVIDFSLPIQTEAISALVAKDKPYQTMDDLNSADVHLVEVRGTTPVDFVKDRLPKAQVTLFDNYPDAVRAFEQGRGDAIVDVVDYLGAYTKNYSAETRVITDKSASIDYDCIGLAQGNTALKSWVNVALYQLQTNGFMKQTYKQWFGIDMVYPVPVTPYF